MKGSDAGTYTCAAENDYGRDTAPVKLSIGAPPRIIVSDYGMVVYGGGWWVGGGGSGWVLAHVKDARGDVEIVLS